MTDEKTTNGPDLAHHAANFLEHDFQESFAQMRHYDGQIFDALKFSFTAYTALIGISVGLYQFSQKQNTDLIPAAIAILIVGFLVGITMFAFVVRSRVHFVFLARYVNEQRKLFLDQHPLGFNNVSGMHTNPHRPQFFNWRSTQAMMLYLLAALNSVLFAGLLFTLFHQMTARWCIIPIGFILVLAVQLASAILYLRSREGKRADTATFGTTAG